MKYQDEIEPIRLVLEQFVLDTWGVKLRGMGVAQVIYHKQRSRQRAEAELKEIVKALRTKYGLSNADVDDLYSQSVVALMERIETEC